MDKFAVTDVGSRFDPACLSDAAAVLKCVDLVVTVDTAIAHLAGGLGVPVWLALACVPDWRWLLEREDSPWYPTMKLFRQSQRGRWDDVFERMTAELAKVRGGGSNQAPRSSSKSSTANISGDYCEREAQRNLAHSLNEQGMRLQGMGRQQEALAT